MKIEPYDRLRFLVESATEMDDQGKPIGYVVDLTANPFDWGRFGACTCMHFQTRIQPAIRKAGHAHPSARCKHLVAAFEHFTQLCIQSYIDQNGDDDHQD